MDVQLETERLLLRRLTPDDLPGLFALDSDPEVHRYLGNQPVQSMAEVEKNLAYIHRQYQENGIGRLAMIAKDSGAFIGWSGLKYETEFRSEFPYYDLGYRLRRKYWGQGYATEAARASLRHGFIDLALSEICAAAHVDNAGSNRILAQKLGMNYLETVSYQGMRCNWYQISKHEWRTKREN